MSIKNYFLGLAFLLALWAPSLGQQDPQYSQYMFNGLAVNPAYAGSKEWLSATLLLREQWVGIEGRPRTQSLSMHAPSVNLRHGFGGSVVMDHLGITTQMMVDLSYAYRIPIGKGWLAMGLKGGGMNFRNDWRKPKGNDIDLSIPQSIQSVFMPRVGTGLFFNTDRFYAGVAVPNFIPNKYKYKDLIGQDFLGKQQMHVFGSAGMVFKLSNSIKLKPSFLLKWVQHAPIEFDLNANMFFKDRIGLGASYRTGDAMVFMIEYFHNATWRVGYSYDLTLTKLRQVNSGSHEIMIGFDLAPNTTKILTPRYF